MYFLVLPAKRRFLFIYTLLLLCCFPEKLISSKRHEYMKFRPPSVLLMRLPLCVSLSLSVPSIIITRKNSRIAKAELGRKIKLMLGEFLQSTGAHSAINIENGFCPLSHGIISKLNTYCSSTLAFYIYLTSRSAADRPKIYREKKNMFAPCARIRFWCEMNVTEAHSRYKISLQIFCAPRKHTSRLKQISNPRIVVSR